MAGGSQVTSACSPSTTDSEPDVGWHATRPREAKSADPNRPIVDKNSRREDKACRPMADLHLVDDCATHNGRRSVHAPNSCSSPSPRGDAIVSRLETIP